MEARVENRGDVGGGEGARTVIDVQGDGAGVAAAAAAVLRAGAAGGAGGQKV